MNIRMKYLFTCLFACILLASCNSRANDEGGEKKEAKYEPEDGRCFIFIGQDLGAVGGMEGYREGYCDYFETPAGVTVYLGLSGKDDKVSGLTEIADWGSGDCCADKYIETGRFNNSMIAAGLAMVGQETQIASGERDKNLDIIAAWIKKIAPRPVFLRIGYEFDGADWNHYVPETYIPAYKYIKDRFDAAGVGNVAYVWQSKGHGTPLPDMDKWYPGNDYVDWCGYSHFEQPDKVMIEFARKKGKPVFIAESTPLFKEGQIFFDADIKKPEIARKMWDEWFTKLFRVIEENQDVVKAVSYINVNWMSQSMWVDDINFNQCDSRIQESEYVSAKWSEKMKDRRYVNADKLDWYKLPQ
jgi:hypothetical protein